MINEMDQDPRFLITLAAEYVKQSPLDRALDILAKISATEKEAHRTAQSLFLRIHFIKKDFPRVICHPEALEGDRKIALWISPEFSYNLLELGRQSNGPPCPQNSFCSCF